MSRETPTDLTRFVMEVVSRLGFHVHQHNEAQVVEVLQHALERTGCSGVEQYLSRFAEPDFADRELRAIAIELSVAETYFFRHREHFRALADVAVPERIIARGQMRRLNLLSAGCASGEEAYSLAAAASEIAALRGWEIHIIGVDVNAELIDKACRGRYSQWSLRGVAPAERGRYFNEDSGEFVIRDELKSAVEFQWCNLMDETCDLWRADRFDVIFCRNVMIYLSPPAVRSLAQRLTGALSPGGFLFLGPSETLRGISQDYHLRHTHGTFYYQHRLPHEQRGPAQPVAIAAPGPDRGAVAPPPAPQDSPDAPWAVAIAKASRRVAALAGTATPETAAPPEPAFPSREDLDEVHDLLRQERFDEALAAIGSLARGQPADSDVLLLRAVVLANTGALAEAQAACEELLARDELAPGAHYLMAVCHERGGRHLAAAEHDQAAIYLDSAFAMPHLHLGLLARRLGDLTTARRELTEALARLDQEDASHILLFGGGFSREALVRFCRAQLDLCGDRR